MVKIQTGNELGTAILKALDIDGKGVVRVQIDCQPNEMAALTIVRSLDKGEGDKLVTELRKYVLFATGGTVADSKSLAMETIARNLTRG